MGSLIDRIKRFARGPQGRKARAQAERLARSPQAQRARAKAERLARDPRTQAKARSLLARLRGGRRH